MNTPVWLSPSPAWKSGAGKLLDLSPGDGKKVPQAAPPSALIRAAMALVLVCLLCGTGVVAQEPVGISEMQRLFQSPPDEARIMMRWWWFGPAVTKREISRELRAMKDAGIGGVEIQPVYPVALDDPATGIKNLPFLSDEYLEALRYANEEARALGLRVDVTLGSGWPFGGPSVPITQAAGRLRVERVKLEHESIIRFPRMSESEKLEAVFAAYTEDGTLSPENTVELRGIKDGEMMRNSSETGKTCELLFFISSQTRQQVKRPGVGGEGLVLNHYDRSAVDAYLKNVGDPIIGAFGDKSPYSVFCDSLEVYLSDWTPDFLSEFERRRGYSLKPYLPALTAEFGPQTEAIRHDWGETLKELLDERFIQPVREWARQHRTLFRSQCYGTPPATLSSNRFVDLPEGEGFHWKSLSATRWATSASHLYGRPVTSSETWTWLHSPSFRATPLDMKAEADLHFLQGINQIIGHGWPYSAPSAEYPGWRLYAAGAFDDKNPWWIVMPDLTRYLQRASYLLRQGQPANDVAIYLPNHDGWAHLRNKQVNLFETLRDYIGKDVVAAVLEAGYNFDFFDDEALARIGKVEQGALVLGANKYKAVILPNAKRVPLSSLTKLAEFAQRGGIVIATGLLPERVPGLNASVLEQKEAEEIALRLFARADSPAHFVGDENTELASKLQSLLQPDIAFSGDKADLGFIHRHTSDAEIYFIANTGPLPRKVDATFRVSGAHAEFWNPFTGESSSVATSGKEGNILPLELEPYESRFIVFTHRDIAGERSAAGPVTHNTAPLDLSSDWQVSFENGLAAAVDKLHSWTEDEATRYYSGRATYEKAFEVPQEHLQQGTRVFLDFGPGKALPVDALKNGMRAWLDAPVREAAVVEINGERAGTVWLPPYRLEVTHLLRPGANRIKVTVGNTAINYMAGHPLPDYKLLNQRYGERFVPQDMENLRPIPSGLLGPVRLLLER